MAKGGRAERESEEPVLETFLAASERRTYRAVCEVLLPEDVRCSMGGAAVDPVALGESFAAASPFYFRAFLRGALRFLEWSPPLFGRFGRLSSLAPRERARVLGRLDRCSSYHVRQIFKLVKVYSYWNFYSAGPVTRHIGYDPAENKARAERWKALRARMESEGLVYPEAFGPPSADPEPRIPAENAAR